MESCAVQNECIRQNEIILENVLCECVFEVCDHIHHLGTDYAVCRLYRPGQMKRQEFRVCASPFTKETRPHISKRSTTPERVMLSVAACFLFWR